MYFIDYARGSYSEAAGDERYLSADSGLRSQIEYKKQKFPNVASADLPGKGLNKPSDDGRLYSTKSKSNSSLAERSFTAVRR